jgi:predicted DNA-binding transcriptional regulator YafY
MSKYERLARMMKIMILIKAQTKPNRRDLAKECEVSVRTIQRDINSLSYAGVPVFWAEGGYEIMPDFFLSPVNLSLEEALYLVIAAMASCESKGESYKRNMEFALSKIIASLPSEVRDQVKAAMDIATSEGKSYSQILDEIEDLVPDILYRPAYCVEFVPNRIQKRPIL